MKNPLTAGIEPATFRIVAQHLNHCATVVPHKETGAIEKTVLDRNPQGYRRGRPKRTWQRIIEDEIRSTRSSWNEVRGIAGDCNAWKLFMDVLCSTGSKRN